MTSPAKINLDETFPILTRAPIVEAIIDFRARATAPFDVASVSKLLAEKLPDYPNQQTLHEFPEEIATIPYSEAPVTVSVKLDWRLRLSSDKIPQIAVFSRDGISLSRLEPCNSWNELSAEALKLWNIYMEIAQPLDIQRIGIRSINRILIPEYGEFNMEEYINPAPQPPRDLGLVHTAFFHKDVLEMPGYPYVITIIQTVQQQPSALVLDIDIVKPTTTELHPLLIANELAEMRWLKNKAFFGTITEKVLEIHK